MGRISAVFKADGAETGQLYSISEWCLDPHTKGSGAHSHPEDDVFYVLAGTMSVSRSGSPSTLPAIRASEPRDRAHLHGTASRYHDQPVDTLRPTASQIGFAQVALLRILPTARYPERQQWIDQYKAISSSVDAALFMTEARLKLQHGMDFKRFDRPDNPDKAARRRPAESGW